MRALITSVTVAILALTAGAVSAQDHSAHAKPAVQAFEHYEQIRVALSADKLADVAPHATALAVQVDAVGGAPAKQAAEQLAAAKTIEDARTHFGELSTILVPLFQAEAIPGAHAFVCDMKNKSWMQRGEKIENPYYGKSMLTCGRPIKK